MPPRWSSRRRSTSRRSCSKRPRNARQPHAQRARHAERRGVAVALAAPPPITVGDDRLTLPPLDSRFAQGGASKARSPWGATFGASARARNAISPPSWLLSSSRRWRRSSPYRTGQRHLRRGIDVPVRSLSRVFGRGSPEKRRARVPRVPDAALGSQRRSRDR